MLLIVVYWFMLIPLFLGWGLIVQDTIRGVFHFNKEPVSVFVLLFLGVSWLGLLANILSFFVPLGTGPFLIGILYGLSVLFLFLKKEIWRKQLDAVHFSWVNGLILLFIFCIVLIKSASPSEIMDEGGYYLPFIKWVEQFGITPGLANLQGRFGFNSSWHIMSALLSLRWSGTVFYDLNGLLLLIFVSYQLFGIASKLTPMRYCAGLFVCAFVFRNFLTSSAADLPNIYLSATIILFMIEKFELKTMPVIDFSFVAAFIVGCFLITVKPSSIYLLLIFLPVMCMYVFNHRMYPIWILLLIGGFFIFPWMFRFYITTGYIVFPVPGIDLFNPDWKLPSETVLSEYNGVKCFPISDQLPTDVVLKMTIADWFPSWFKKGFIENKVFFVAIWIGSFYFLFTIKKFAKTINEQLFGITIGIVFLNIVIWFTQYPDFRFAWGFILLYVFIACYLVADSISFLKKNVIVFVTLFLVLMSFMNVVKTLKDARPYIKNIAIYQAPLPEGKIDSIYKNNIRFYKSDTAWDLPLPSILKWQDPDIELRGKTLKDGFRNKE